MTIGMGIELNTRTNVQDSIELPWSENSVDILLVYISSAPTLVVNVLVVADESNLCR